MGLIKEYVGPDKKYRLRPWVRYAAGAMAAVLTIGSMGIIPKALQEVGASQETAQVRAINLGTLGINDPVVPDSADDSWNGSYVYFGNYEDKSLLFRVLDKSTQEFNAQGDTNTYTMLLEADSSPVMTRMANRDTDATSSAEEIYVPWDWESSYARSYLNSTKTDKYNNTKNGFLTAAFSKIEQEAIAVSVKSSMSEYDSNKRQDYFSPLTGEKVFILDHAELLRPSYGYLDDSGDSATRIKTDVSGTVLRAWRVRTKSIEGHSRVITGTGSANASTASAGDVWVCPAVNINLDRVAFVSQSNTLKADSLRVTDIISDTALHNKWNLTLKDSEGFDAVRIGDDAGVKAGERVTISVTKIPTLSDGSAYTQISAMLVDKAGTVIAYGKVGDAKLGQMQVRIPADITQGEYTMKVFAEQVNSSATLNLTDYASNTVDVTIAVAPSIATVEVEDILQPVAGAELDMSATCGHDKVVSTTLAWKMGDLDVTGVADYEKVYTAYATLIATEGVVFAEDVTATVNGNPATSVKLNDDGTLTVGYTFEATGEKPSVAKVKQYNLGINGLHDPKVLDNASAPWSGSYVYFGWLQNQAVMYRVLDASTKDYNAEGDNDTRTMLLESDTVLLEYHYDYYGDSWTNSFLRSTLNSKKAPNGSYDYDWREAGFLNLAHTTADRAAIAKSTRKTPIIDGESLGEYVPIEDDKIFILSPYEYAMPAYGYTNSQFSTSRIKTYNYVAKNYWARGKAAEYNSVDTTGSHMVKNDSTGVKSGVVPALNLDISKILYNTYTSAVKPDKVELVESFVGVERWKLTIEESTGFQASLRTGQSGEVVAGDDVMVQVTAMPKMLSGGEFKQISAMIVDSDETVVAYGKVWENLGEGAGYQVDIPKELPSGKYTLKLFGETIYSDVMLNHTDYGTNMASIELDITGAVNSVAITDIEEPKVSKNLDTKAACGTEGVATKTPSVSWKDVTDENVVAANEPIVAEGSKQYEATVILSAESGYAFATTTTATVNGNKATSVVLNADGTLTVTYVFATTDKEKMQKPDITINYREEELEGFLTNGNYTINSIPVTVTDGKVTIEEKWFGTNVSIVLKASGEAYDDSEPQILYIPERPDAPNVVGVDETIYGANDGKIQRTTVDMEYRRVIPVPWNDCVAEEVVNLGPGYYEVRLKATDTSFAGKSAQVEIKTGIHVCDVIVVNGTGSGTYSVGDIITVVADAAPDGKQFKCWSVVYGLAQLGDARDATTTLVVPQGAVEIKAEYEDITEVEPPTESETEPPTEATTEETTEITTEASTEVDTELTTEIRTELTTESSTERVTQKPTEESSESSTETEVNTAPDTGDDNIIIWFFVAMILSACIMISVYGKDKTAVKKN